MVSLAPIRIWPPVEELGLALLDQVHGRLDMAHEDLTLRCELDFLRAPDKERLVQFPLQRLNGLAYGGLGYEKLF